MIGYGAAKAATIHIGRSLAAANSGLPNNASVLTIAPYVFMTLVHDSVGREERTRREKPVFCLIDALEVTLL